jgi:UDP-N-acetylmuramoyl-L-alanyl-D-glutamate--2,6-diaminopimelate ligase
MEQLSAPSRVLVVIDYAHTPDALEKTLSNLKEVAQERHGKLWCVFGCGGDRDPGKRPEMGKIAEIADQIMVTSDNPRSEEPELIIAQIVAGMAPDRYPAPMIQPDRAKAILYAINYAGKNDVVLLAGKGHEAYQEIKGKKLPFSDSDHAHIALANLASKGVGL